MNRDDITRKTREALHDARPNPRGTDTTKIMVGIILVVVLLFAFGILGCQVTVKPETAPHNLQEELLVTANS